MTQNLKNYLYGGKITKNRLLTRVALFIRTASGIVITFRRCRLQRGCLT